MSGTHQLEAALFDAALELPVEQRSAYLERACEGDPDLRRRVEALLRASEVKSEFLDGSSPGAQLAAGEIHPAFEKPGDWVDRYRLLQKIGEGGCGVVYMAEQEALANAENLLREAIEEDPPGNGWQTILSTRLLIQEAHQRLHAGTHLSSAP